MSSRAPHSHYVPEGMYPFQTTGASSAGRRSDRRRSSRGSGGLAGSWANRIAGFKGNLHRSINRMAGVQAERRHKFRLSPMVSRHGRDSLSPARSKRLHGPGLRRNSHHG